MTGEHMSLKHA